MCEPHISSLILTRKNMFFFLEKFIMYLFEHYINKIGRKKYVILEIFLDSKNGT